MERLSESAKEVLILIAALPVPGSTALIAHVGDMAAQEAEDGLNELPALASLKLRLVKGRNDFLR